MPIHCRAPAVVRSCPLQRRSTIFVTSEDPFEDDEFFKAPTDVKLANNNNNNNGSQLAKSGTGNGSGGGVGGGTGGFQCDDDFNFAKFDENM
ncbi:unnamed protein product [Ceratitis capitata]|uniref:(Mediterranean fruit fly) hypothetical protein n=1 Tax=Ceratitis capitata TaxID=7213 RepID=A0A811UY20_CERCA|nr:unnamed protein product [Ceratitis capitata]